MARLGEGGTPVRSVSEPDIDTDTSDPTKVLLRQILGSIGQYERALIRGRMQAGKMIKAAKGGYVGGQPAYGQRAENQELVASPQEAALVDLVMTLRASGHSYRAICVALQDAGFKPRRAERWHPAVVRSMVLTTRRR